MSNMKFSTSDGGLFQVDAEIAKSWPMIKSMEDLDIDEEEKDEIIPLARIDSDALKKVIVWSAYHKDDPPTDEEDDEISDWDENFLKVDQSTLFGLIRAASFLGIKELLRVTCKTVANMLKGQTPEKIREIFNLPDDLTEEEKDKVRNGGQLDEEM